MNSSVTHSVTTDEIHLGFWTNWSHGRIRGATLTLTRRDGGLLIAFLALFVSLVGTCFWRITCFVIHRLVSSTNPQDGIYHQRQAVLRNAASGTSALWSLLQITWAWRHHTRLRLYRRIFPITTFTLILVSTFALAGIFSSQISTSMGNEVLLSGRNCGILDQLLGDPTRYQDVFLPYLTQRVHASANYAQMCYRSSPFFQNCPVYVQKSLSWSRHDTQCPFPGGEKICRNSTNLRLDTGFIDSMHDLGINSPPEDRFLFRSMLECAPLRHEGYSENLTMPSRNNETSPGRFIRYNLGIQVDSNLSTYEYTAEPPGYGQFENLPVEVLQDYHMAIKWTYTAPNGSVKQPGSQFIPIADLHNPSADVSLIFLSANNIPFVNPVEDPWYSAHVSGGKFTTVDESMPVFSVYYRDDPVRVLGCTSRYQFCNPNVEGTKSCIAPTGILAAYAQAGELWQTKKQKALFDWSALAIRHNGIGLPEVISGLGISALTSRYRMAAGLQGPLPDNQWQLEVEHWFTTILADFQRMVVEAATGPTDLALNDWARRPDTPEARSLCASQRVRSDLFTSFSTLGLAILGGVGALIIVLSYSLEFVADWIQKRLNLDTYKRLEWTTNEALELQRLAHEEAGFGTWSNTDEETPVTVSHEKLARLDISNPEHPTLERGTTKLPCCQEKRANQDGADVTEEVTVPAGLHMTESSSDSAVTDTGPRVDH